MEATVTGYITGREGKLLGLMGALEVTLDDGKVLKLSGFTDLERELESDDGAPVSDWAKENPETRCPYGLVRNPRFPVGLRVTLKHRGFTDDGYPNEARYWRKRVDL